MKNRPFMVREAEEVESGCAVLLRQEAAGFSFPLHWHDYFELEILLAGHGRHVCNGMEYPIAAGDVWLMSLCDFHAIHLDCDTTYLHIAFGKGFLPPDLESLIATQGLRHRSNPAEAEVFRSIGRELIEETNQRSPYCEDVQRLLITRLVIQLLRFSRPDPHCKTPPSIGAVSAYIHEHFREDLSLEALAQTYGFSKNYFGKLFRDAVGLPFRDYLNKIRLKYACELLSASKLGIKEIAYAAGYQSVEYFLYVFKKSLSVTPGDYRKNARG